MPSSSGGDAEKDSGAWLLLRQMGAMLRKNYLLKKADWRQTVAEVVLPGLFMLLLVWIKSLTTVFDSPTAAYTCGQTIPWQYEKRLPKNPVELLDNPLIKCLQQPPSCTEKNYYRDEGGVFEQIGMDGFYTTVGYTEAGANYPWYGFTVGDSSRIYADFQQLTGVSAYNPSQDLRSMVHRLVYKGQKSFIAVAPREETEAEGLAAEAFVAWLVHELGGPKSVYAPGVRLFPSEQAVIDYVKSADYDKIPSAENAKRGATAGYPVAEQNGLESDTEFLAGMEGGDDWGDAGGGGSGGSNGVNEKVGMAVIFNEAPENGGMSWDYTLRFNYTYGVSQLQDQATCLYSGCHLQYKLPSTLVTTDALERPPTSDYMFGYGYTGFLTVQKAVDEYILSSTLGERMYLNVSMALFPEKAYITDQFQQIIANTLGIFYMLAFLYPVSRAIRVLVSEKEGRMKEALRMMGLPDFIYHSSWLVTFQAQWVISNILIVLAVRTSVFKYSNKWLVMLWLEAVSLAIMAFCFLISTFFSRSKTAATLGSVIFFAAFQPYYFVGGDMISTVATKTWTSLLVPTCVALGADTFAAFEGGLVGVQVSNSGQSYADRIPYVTAIVMLLVDAVVYLMLAWYLDKVIPSEFGTPLPWHFPITNVAGALQQRRLKRATARPSSGFDDSAAVENWEGRVSVSRGRFKRRQDNASGERSEYDLGMPLMEPRAREASSGLYEVHDYDQEKGAEVEPVGPQLSRQVQEDKTVSTRGLMKVYDNGKVAVKGLNLDLFEGQISVLLGHNGAGKSTAISMITGTLPPTQGEVHVRGRRLSRDLVGIRRSLGVCFQQNTLFDQLTVTQHLELFATVKGVKSKDVRDEAAKMVSEVGLVEKRHTPASALSGGQKRKLSVALAFIGGSEVVVLDEPTSGMDPFSRRSTWSVLQRQRKGRVILLTTHFMDEADTLGDRIAIMAEGELRCMGSSLFLKSLYGVGYTLTVIRKDHELNNGRRDSQRALGDQDGSSGVGLGGDERFSAGLVGNDGDNLGTNGDGKQDALHDLVVQYVPEALVISDVGKERNYRLPFASAGKFVGMFREMDDKKRQLGIAGYGVSVTTLEEVFLRVGHGSDEPLADTLSGGIDEVIPSARLPSVELSPSSSTNRLEIFGSSGEPASPPGEGDGAKGTSCEESKQDTGRDEQTKPSTQGTANGASEDTPTEDLNDKKQKLVESSGVGSGNAKTSMFWVHFKALVSKRTTYGLRDKKSMFFQLIVPTLLFLFGLILLRAGRSFFDQPSLQLSPAMQFNPEIPSALRNPVPLAFPQEPSLARSVAERFDGVSVEGIGVSTAGTAVDDEFAGCAQGAGPLVNMSDFLLKPPTSEEEGASRYGAVVLDESSHLPSPGALANDPGSLVYGVLVNASAVHAAPMFMNLVNTAALQSIANATRAEKHAAVGNGEGDLRGVSGAGGEANKGRLANELPSITIRSSPLPRTTLEERSRQSIEGFSTAIMVVIAVCFLPASYAIFVVKERAVKAKHQQMISGVGVAAYWASTYVFDILTYLVPCSVFLGLIYAFNVPSYTENEGAVATALLFLLYGPAVAPFTYCISFLFDSASSAQNIVLFVNFVTGLALMVTSFVLNLVESTRDVNSKLKWLYRFFPGFCLGDGLAQLVLCDKGETCTDISSLEITGMPVRLTPLSPKIAGADILCLVACSVGYMALCFAIEYSKAFPKLRGVLSRDPHVPIGSVATTTHGRSSNTSADHATSHSGRLTEPLLESSDAMDSIVEDVDVAAEGARVERIFGRADAQDSAEVVLNGLRKVYRTKQGPKVAVHQLSFAVSKGDCFGFLGINGAGKSTTLGILSGDISPTAGEATIAGHDILTEQSKLRRYIGYCPQEEALLDLLTVEEHLLLYARIKGVREELLAKVAGDKMDEMDLRPFQKTKACELSGGNKRKLSVAIAMIGEPRVVFLDEPSTGMDPIARRFMWDIISRMTTKDRECSVILTTHSMEEAESLCNNIGIMVNGRLRCLGSTQHLKHRFGKGFEADMKLHKPSSVASTGVLRVLQEKRPGPIIGEGLDRARLMPPLDVYCRALAGGSSARADAMEEALQYGSGSFLQDVIGSEGGTVPARLFIDWYLCEDRAAELELFLSTTFPGSELVERPTLFSCRYKIAHQEGMTLADVFRHFEEAKTELGLASYAVGQTTLEQIFNNFAASRENPEVGLGDGN